MATRPILAVIDPSRRLVKTKRIRKKKANGKIRVRKKRRVLRRTFVATLSSVSDTHDFRSDAAAIRVLTR